MTSSPAVGRAATFAKQKDVARNPWQWFSNSPFSVRNISLVYVWALLFLLFSLWVPDTFLTLTTWKSLAAEQAVTTILAMSAVIALATGVFDLSLATMLGAAAMLVSWLMVHGASPVLAALITVTAAALVGFISGTAVVVLRVNAFIATLAVSSMLAAFTEAVSNNQLIVGLPNSFTHWATFRLLGLQGAFWIAVAIAAIVWFVLEHRPVGRYMFATGGNVDAARLAGVRTNRVIFGAMIFAALIAAVAGVVVTSRLGTGSPTIGPPYLLPAFASAFLGSTQVHPGRFNVLGTLIAIFALATAVKGLQLAGAPSWLPDLVNGAVLLLAVAVAVRRRRSILTAEPQAITDVVTAPMTLRQSAREAVHLLRDRSGETVSLIEIGTNGAGKVVEVAESPAVLRASAWLGEAVPADELQWLNVPLSDNEALPILFAERDDVFEVRVQVTNGSRPVGVLSVRAPGARATPTHRQEIETALRDTAAAVTASIAGEQNGGGD